MTRAAIEQATQNAIEEIGAGRFASAESRCREILAALPDHADALHLLANIAHLVGRNALAVALAKRAIAIHPAVAQYYNTLGIGLHNERRYDMAIDAYRNALQLRPHYAISQSNLANTLRDLGRLEEAIEAYRTAIEWSPDFADAHANLGIALNSAGKWSEAIASYRAAIRLKPDSADAHNNLGGVLTELGRLDEAIEEFETAIKLKPDYALAHENLGAAAANKGHPEHAIEACLTALKLQPGLPEAHCNLGTALKDNGQIEEALAAYREALALRPDDAVTHSNLVYTLQFQSGVTPAAISNEQMLWNRAHAEPLRHFRFPLRNNPDPDRRLKIGYVSPDLRDHAVAFFLRSLLEEHDRTQVEVHCYSCGSRRDAVSEQLRRKTDVWHDVQLLSDSQLADQIRADGIDMLVDLSMHTAYNRLLAFGRRPAPVQVSWLAYAGSTGLETIDYRLTDSMIEPPQDEEVPGHERPYRLPDAWCCYQPGSEFPAPGELPARGIGRITFGSVNRLCKVNPAVIRCWAGVLREVGDSTLLMLAPEGRSRERILQMFETHGISKARVEFVGYCSRSEYLKTFQRMDIVLDTFPYNGMTTTCHALWMGLPVLTLPGDLPASRTALSILSTICLAEWAADSEKAYARIAAELGGDLSRLSELRATLRGRMERSSLMDAPRFARNIEQAYRTMWVDRCAKTAE